MKTLYIYLNLKDTGYLLSPMDSRILVDVRHCTHMPSFEQRLSPETLLTFRCGHLAFSNADCGG